MSRIQLASLGVGVAQNPSGGILAGLNGTIYVMGTNNPVTVWSAYTGGTSNTTGTFTTDSFGRIPGWVDSNAFPQVDVTIPPAPTVSVTLSTSVAITSPDNSLSINGSALEVAAAIQSGAAAGETALQTITSPNATISVTAGDEIDVVYGTAVNTSAEGNDSRITGAAQKAQNLADLASASTARTNLGLGSAATHASTDFDAAGAAATAQTNAETFATNAANVAQVNAEAASDPLGSATAAQSNAETFATNAANTAQSNAEAASLPITGGTMTGTLVLHADATTGKQAVTYEQLGSAAFDAASAFDAAGAAATAQTNAETFATNSVATETTRAEAAEAGLLPKSGTFTSGHLVQTNGTAATDSGIVASSVVTSLTAEDTSIVVGGTASAPTLETGTLDVIATDHPPAANWSNNSKKITSLANGAAASDAAAFGQIPTALPPNGAAGGSLSGTYPNPGIASSVALPGSPTTTTQASADNSTNVATTAFVQTAAGVLIPKSAVTAKGDLIVASASGAVSNLAVGNDTYVLTADSTQTLGVKWAASAGGSSGVTFIAGSTGNSATLPATISFTHPNTVLVNDICCVFAATITPAATYGGTSIANFQKVTLPTNTGFYGNAAVMLYEQVVTTSETVSLSVSGSGTRVAWVVMYFRAPRNYGSTTTVSAAHTSTPTIPNGTGPAFVFGAMYGTGGSSTTAIPTFGSAYATQVSSFVSGTNPVAVRVGGATNPVGSTTISVPDIDAASILINWV